LLIEHFDEHFIIFSFSILFQIMQEENTSFASCDEKTSFFMK